ncbi:MAG TPA: thymidine phosphorylase [Elusimicrobiota bacterium]|nr:thymidine phosphorylase [Elusimicrobiota bacterium]
MNAYDVIFKKRNGGTLIPEEIAFFIQGVTGGSISKEQAAAWLMASFIRGLDDTEMAALTRTMTDSGDIIDLSALNGSKVDKHSTGGVGDGTSLVLAPLLAASGALVPMMSGRALGHTGGTLDKLEAIPGFRVDLSVDELKSQLKTVGCAIFGQTARVAPADKTLYALRDVTATVDSIPLIAASIMSKKLAEGTEALVLDVKTGTGAFMTTMDGSRALAKAMVAIGKKSGKKMLAVISDMNQPLGAAAGNSLEIWQAIQVLCGKGPDDFRELVLTLGVWMLILAGRAGSEPEARKKLESALSSGAALEKFRQMVKAQGGDVSVVDGDTPRLPQAPFQKQILSPVDGVVTSMDTRLIGLLVSGLGAGRSVPGAPVDNGVGLVFHKKIGDAVRSGEPLATVHHRNEDDFEGARRQYLEAVSLAGRPEDKGPLPKVKRPPLVYEIIR